MSTRLCNSFHLTDVINHSTFGIDWYRSLGSEEVQSLTSPMRTTTGPQHMLPCLVCKWCVTICYEGLISWNIYLEWPKNGLFFWTHLFEVLQPFLFRRSKSVGSELVAVELIRSFCMPLTLIEVYFTDVCVEGGLLSPRGIWTSRLDRNTIPTFRGQTLQ